MVGVGLIVLGVLLALAVIPLWTNATEDAEAEQLAEEFRAASLGTAPEEVEPERTIPIAVGMVGAVLFLAGVIVTVSPDRPRVPDPGPGT